MAPDDEADGALERLNTDAPGLGESAGSTVGIVWEELTGQQAALDEENALQEQVAKVTRDMASNHAGLKYARVEERLCAACGSVFALDSMFCRKCGRAKGLKPKVPIAGSSGTPSRTEEILRRVHQDEAGVGAWDWETVLYKMCARPMFVRSDHVDEDASDLDISGQAILLANMIVGEIRHRAAGNTSAAPQPPRGEKGAGPGKALERSAEMLNKLDITAKEFQTAPDVPDDDTQSATRSVRYKELAEAKTKIDELLLLAEQHGVKNIQFDERISALEVSGDGTVDPVLYNSLKAKVDLIESSHEDHQVDMKQSSNWLGLMIEERIQQLERRVTDMKKSLTDAPAARVPSRDDAPRKELKA